MNLLYDTNIVVNIIRSNNQDILAYLNPDNTNVYISVATEAEIKSLAIRNSWDTRFERPGIWVKTTYGLPH